MKIPFDIKFRPQIESGEYKLETECGHPVSIMDWEWIDRNEKKCLAVKVLMDEGYNVGYLFNYDGKRHSIFPSDSDSDLFIVTPEEQLTDEEELTDFEDAFGLAMMEVPEPEEKEEWYPFLKEKAAELLALAIDARAKELSKGLEQSKIDKDSIPYHLIEFMCNLYDCQNWKEIEETAELYATRLKAAALKDLPRWEKDDSIKAEQHITVGKNGERFHYKGHSLLISNLTKLPGFKED